MPDLIVVGLILAGGAYFAKMLIFNRESWKRNRVMPMLSDTATRLTGE